MLSRDWRLIHTRICDGIASAYRLGAGDVGARRWDVCLQRVKESDTMLQQVQHGVPQNGAVQLKGLSAVKGLLDIRCHREGLVGAAPQRLYHLPHLHRHQPSYYLIAW